MLWVRACPLLMLGTLKRPYEKALVSVLQDEKPHGERPHPCSCHSIVPAVAP